MDAKLAEKFEKIRNLMEGAATEGEAQAAAAAFQRLVAKWNVDEAEALRATGQTEPPIIMSTIVIAQEKTFGVGWRNELFHTILRFNFCRGYNPGTGGWHRVVVLGQEENIRAACRLFEMTSVAFQRLALSGFERALDQHYKEQARRNYPSWMTKDSAPKKMSWTNSFLLGANSGLYDKLDLERQDEIKTEPGVRDLVVVKDDALQQAEDDMFQGRLSKSSGYESRDPAAWREGYRTGRSWSTEQPMSATTTRAIRGGDA